MDIRAAEISPILNCLAAFDQPGLARPLIFDEFVTVPISVRVDPVKRSLDMRPQLPHRLDVARALEV